MVLGAPPLAKGGVEEGWAVVKLLPFHRFEINSPLDRQAALAAIAAHTEPEKWYRWRWPSSANDDRFEGQIGADSFHVRRIIGYRNSFLPVVDGTVHAAGRGSKIEVQMRPFAFVAVFAAVWVAGVSVALFTPMWPFGLGMLAFFYAMTMGGFWYEASKQEQTLQEIFQAR